MASDFRVQVGNLSSGVSELQSMNESFKTIMKDLETSTTTLSSQWEGESKTKYTNAMIKDIGVMSQFYTLMQQYIEALSTIAQKYSTTEQTNAGLVK